MQSSISQFITGLGVGVGVSYLFSPTLGRRHRARIRDKLEHYTRAIPDALDVAGRDLAHRARGTVAQARAAIRREEVEDSILVDRVRSKIGRVVSHPHAIEVIAHEGKVTLCGFILKHELKALLDCASKVSGVSELENRLEAHKQDDSIPSLQGGRAQSASYRLDVLQKNWSPATRALMSCTGGVLVAAGLVRRSPLSVGLGIAGSIAIARSVTNIELKRLFGLSDGRRGVEIHKTIHIHAPVEEVYGFWSRFENFPRFMTEVLDVRAVDEKRSHWTVRGPFGAPISFDSEITAQVDNQVLSWRSVEGSLIQNAGQVKFISENGGTKIELRFCYNPPVGYVGHEFARMLGANPKRRIEMSLAQVKQIIEQGPSPRQEKLLH